MAKKGGSAPAPPDPRVTAASQTQSNVNTAVAQSILGNVDQTTPWGSMTWTRGASTQIPDGNGGFVDVPSWSVSQTLSPEQQQIFDAQNRAEIGMTNLAGDYTQRIAAATAQPWTMEGMPAAPQYDEQYRQQQLDRIVGRNQSQMDRDRQMLETRLANQGIGIGTEAWRNAQDDYARSVNDFRLAADINAGNSAAQVFGLQGQSRDRAISESLTQRNQPLNEVVALLHGGGGVQQPNYVPTPQGQIQPTDVAGITRDAYQAQLAAWQSQQQSQGGLMGSIFGLAGAGLGGWLRSDRRVKRNIERIGTHHTGLPVYAFTYIDDANGERHYGFMADEVRAVKPHAVATFGGVDHVHYGEAVK